MMIPSLELTASAPPPAIIRHLSSAYTPSLEVAPVGYRLSGSETSDAKIIPTLRPIHIWHSTGSVSRIEPRDADQAAVNDLFYNNQYRIAIEPLAWRQVSSGAVVSAPSFEWWPSAPKGAEHDNWAELSGVVNQIAALRDGWAGVGSVAPSPAARSDVKAALSVAPASTRFPAIEVDTDGTIALLWDSDDQSFALTFYGNGRVVGTLSPYSEHYAPWRVEVSDAFAIAERLRAPELAPLLS